MDKKIILLSLFFEKLWIYSKSKPFVYNCSEWVRILGRELVF